MDFVSALREMNDAKQRVTGLVHTGRVNATDLHEALRTHSVQIELYQPNTFVLSRGPTRLAAKVLEDYARGPESRVIVDWTAVEAHLQRAVSAR